MKRLPPNFDWLRIRITQRPASPHQFRLAISFHNQSAARVLLPFSNVTRKAEVFGLAILDRGGCRVEPQRKLYIRPADGDEETHEIPPHGYWEYVLDGLIEDSMLLFPGADYSLNPQQVYLIQFEYQGVISNAIHWLLPKTELMPVQSFAMQGFVTGRNTDAK